MLQHTAYSAQHAVRCATNDRRILLWTSLLDLASHVLLIFVESSLCAQVAPLPKGWREYQNDDGVPYFHHKERNKTVWDQ